MDQLPGIMNRNASRRYYCHACRIEVSVTAELTCVQCKGGFVEEITAESSGNVPGLLGLLRRITPESPSRPSALVEKTTNNNNNVNVSPSDDSFVSTSSGSDVNLSESSLPRISRTTLPTSANRHADDVRGVIMNALLDLLDLLGTVNRSAATDLELNAANLRDLPSTSRRNIFSGSMPLRRREIVLANHPTLNEREFGNDAMNAFIDLTFGTRGVHVSTNVIDNQGDDLTSMLMSTFNRLLPSMWRPLSNDMLEHIPKVEITAEDLANQNMCSICWDEFKLKESVRKLPCSHVFHETCVFPWLKLHRTCPLCRNRLSEDFGCGGLAMEEGLAGEGLDMNDSNSGDVRSFGSDDSNNPDVTNTVGSPSMPDNVN